MRFHFRSHDDYHRGGGVGGLVVPTAHPSALLIVDAHGGAAAGGGEVLGGKYTMDASRHRGECARPSLPPSPPSPTSVHAGIGFFHTSSVASRNPTSGPSGDPSGDHDHGGMGGGDPVTSPLTSKRALHPERHDPHSRRQFFRLGRHRSKSVAVTTSRPASPPCALTSDSSDDELGGRRRAARATVARARRSSRGGEISDDELGGSDRAPRTTLTGRARRSGDIAGLRKPKLRRAQSVAVGPLTPTAARALVAIPSCPCIEATSSFDAMDYSSSSTDAVKIIAPLEKDKTSCSEPVTRRCVTFTSVQLREYSTILGDHPCCPSGLPLSLGWDLIHEGSMEFDQYEEEREPTRARCRGDLRLGEKARRDILRSLVVAAPTSYSGAVGSDSGNDHHDDDGPGTSRTALYSRKELCRAERRLSRDRANLNSRSQRRMNRGFFRPLTATEECTVAGSAVTASEEDDTTTGEKELESPCNKAEGEGSTSTAIDISPIKRPATE